MANDAWIDGVIGSIIAGIIARDIYDSAPAIASQIIARWRRCSRFSRRQQTANAVFVQDDVDREPM